MSHHLFVEPHRRCVWTVMSPCQGYMSTVNPLKVSATQMLIRSCLGWMMPQLELLLVLVSLPW